ncbi:hypothetical protein ABEB36_015457 [Hypothenemus hampei]|uniref:Uncharacterized protein n=1 Tax=Hypothenemus hampei TaxID=57062 RepID=A0ABD1E2Z9_HYPHA
MGYTCSFGYVVKELAIFDGLRCTAFLFQPPFSKALLSDPDKNIVKWAEDHYHGLEWESGYVSLNELEPILMNLKKFYNNPKIFIKGMKKFEVLKEFLSETKIHFIPNESEPMLSKYKSVPECYFHKSVNSWQCAIKNVKLLFNFKYHYE